MPSPVAAQCAIAAVAVDRDPAGVEVESMSLVVSYTVPGAEGPRGISYLAFGPDRNLVWLRSSGHLDSVEWCPSCAHYVAGANRDGGLPMPSGHWETSRLLGSTRRLARTEVERDGFGPLSFVAYADRIPGGATSTAPASQRWARWGVNVQGGAHRVRVVVEESTVGVRSLALVFQPVSGPGR